MAPAVALPGPLSSTVSVCQAVPSNRAYLSRLCAQSPQSL